MIKKTHQLSGKHGKDFIVDVYGNAETNSKGVVIFCHGFKGFKDWGTFPMVAQTFADCGFLFVSFNFSHNGTTPDKPTEFADLEAFGNNNFSKELDDLGVVIDFVFDEMLGKVPLPVYLLGHSRGGGISILKAGEDNRVAKVAVWGSVNQFGKFWKHDEMEQMKKHGVIYVPNARTNQQMPIYKQLYEDYEANQARLHIANAVKGLRQDLLIVHGTDDETVPFSAAQEMATWNAVAALLAIENGNHTFGGKHPWHETALPAHTATAIRATINFFEK